jgi:hypothetical protein
MDGDGTKDEGPKMKNPTDFKKGITIQPNPEMTRADHLKELEQQLIVFYNTIEGIEEFGPDRIPNVHNIQRKLLLYRDIYTTLGELAGECERFSLWCDAKKKNEYEKYLKEHARSHHTVKEAENMANIQGQKYRINRDYFMGLSKLWERRRESTLEAINILKWMIRDAHEAKNGN